MSTKNGRATKAEERTPPAMDEDDVPKRLRQFSMYLPPDVAIVLRQAIARTNKSLGTILEPIIREHLHEIRALRQQRAPKLLLKRGRKIAV